MRFFFQASFSFITFFTFINQRILNLYITSCKNSIRMSPRQTTTITPLLIALLKGQKLVFSDHKEKACRSAWDWERMCTTRIILSQPSPASLLLDQSLFSSFVAMFCHLFSCVLFLDWRLVISYWVFVVLDFLFIIQVQLEDFGYIASFMPTVILIS